MIIKVNSCIMISGGLRSTCFHTYSALLHMLFLEPMILVSPEEVEAGTYDESGPYYEYAEVEYEYEDATGEDDVA